MPIARAISLVVGASLSVALVAGGVSQAVQPVPGGGGVRCRAQATKLGDEITATFWLRGARPHRAWMVRIWHDEALASSVTRVTNPHGRFRVRVGVENLPGRDVFRFRAVDRPRRSSCAIRDLIV